MTDATAPYTRSPRGARVIPDDAPWTRQGPELRRLRVQAIPIPGGAKGAKGTGIRFAGRNRAGDRLFSASEHDDMLRTLIRRGFDRRKIGAYILPAPSGLVVVDIDDITWLPWARKTFPETPLTINRGGVVKHLYFRVEPGAKAHKLGLLGPRSIDLIQSTGIVAPGSYHADGRIYESETPLEDLTSLEQIPILPKDWIEDLIAQTAEFRPGRNLAAVVDTTSPSPDAGKGWIHLDEPIERDTGSLFCGYLEPGALVHTIEGKWVAIKQARTGQRCFASYREDHTPSAAVTDHNGRRYFWDYSTGRYWRMLEDTEADTDPDEPLPVACEQRLGIEHEILPSEGWISIDPIPDNTTIFLVAPHGTGKTVFARSEHARAQTSVSVTNTRALTYANAEVLGLDVVHDKPKAKGSVCIPTLTRYEEPPEFFHVDEADAVHGYLHSGNVAQAPEVFDRLIEFCAGSKRCLIASADLTFADIDLYARCIRARNPGRKMKIYYRAPNTDLELVIVQPAIVKEKIHNAIASRRKVFIACSAKKMPGAIAQGYSTATVAVPSVALVDILDPPVPDVIEGMPGVEAGGAWSVSGYNSRYHATVDDLRDPNEIVKTRRLVAVSPAIQSGVSITRRVDRVFALHTHRDLPASALIQMIRRVRNPRSTKIWIGVPKWKPIKIDTSDRYLRMVSETRIKLRDSYMEKLRVSLPDTRPSAEFLRSWRITVRKQLRSRADPIGELVREAKRHGFTVTLKHHKEPPDGSGKVFNARVRAGGEHRKDVNAMDIARAREIDLAERQKIQRAAQLADGDRTAAERYDLRTFYEREVTPALVLLDAEGRYRAACRAWGHMILAAAGELDVIALADAKDEREAVIARHAAARAHLDVSLWRAVVRTEPGEHATATLRRTWTRQRARAWIDAHGRSWAVLYPSAPLPKIDKEDQWFATWLRGRGAEIETDGERKMINMTTVSEYCKPYVERLRRAFLRFRQALEGQGGLPISASGRVDVDALAREIRSRERKLV